jgi:3-hydroxyacyl-CoA dehydrogenase, NAD binding domain
MATVDAAIEAIVEKVGPKKEAFVALDEILSPDALLLSTPPPSPSQIPPPLPTGRIRSAAHFFRTTFPASWRIVS